MYILSNPENCYETLISTVSQESSELTALCYAVLINLSNQDICKLRIIADNKFQQMEYNVFHKEFKVEIIDDYLSCIPFKNIINHVYYMVNTCPERKEELLLAATFYMMKCTTEFEKLDTMGKNILNYLINKGDETSMVLRAIANEYFEEEELI